MASIQFADELVRDYLLFRGFILSVKTFDAELKADKDKGFRPERIVEHLQALIASLDLEGLVEAWSHLEKRIFCRLEHTHSMESRRLESSLFRLYLVNCFAAKKADKANEFFNIMTEKLFDIEDWKDWYVLPYLSSPEENQLFRVYFSRHWQELFWVSLHNFLSAIFKCMPYPSLLKYEQALNKLNVLQEENEALKQKLSSSPKNCCGVKTNETKKCPMNNIPEAPPVLMDDFFVIAQESPAETPPQVNSGGKSLRTLIRNIGGGLPTSPILGRHRSNGANTSRQHSEEIPSSGAVKKTKPRSPSVPPSVNYSGGKTTPEPIPTRKISPVPKLRETPPKSLPSEEESPNNTAFLDSQKGEFIILSQEEYIEHHAPITHCKFNTSGALVASSDLGGVIKVWNPHPTPYTVTTIMSKSNVLALDWAAHKERLLLYAIQGGRVRIYDTKDRRNVYDMEIEGKQNIKCLLSNPAGTHFICSSGGEAGASLSQLLLYDLRTLQLEKQLNMKEGENQLPLVHCCAFNHNSQLLMAGTSKGLVHIFDTRTSEIIASWDAHPGSSVYCLQFSPDETSFYTMGGDGKFIHWDVNKTGKKIAELSIHPEACGPFTYADTTYQPEGKLFSFDSKGSHVLTCGPSGGIIYKLVDGRQLCDEMNLGGHQTCVNTVDWSMGLGCGTCITASLDSQIRVTTLLPQ